MAKQILYYPTIEIPDVAWLKNALLYWDEVSTIVPSRNFQLYGNIAMLSEYGFYKPIFPEDIFNSNMDGFLAELEERLALLPRRDNVPFRIHHNKLLYLHSFELGEQYPEIKSILESASSGGDWEMLGARAATEYMKLLAEYATRDKNDMIIGTSNLRDDRQWRDGYGTAIDVNAWMNFVFEKCVIMPAENVSIEDILSFKADHKKQLIDFQTEIENFRDALSACTSIVDAIEIANAFSQKIELATKTAEETLAGKSLEYIKGSLKAGVGGLFDPGFLIDIIQNGVAQLSIPSITTPALAAAGIHIVASAIQGCVCRSKIKRSNLSYVLSAKEAGLYRPLIRSAAKSRSPGRTL